MSKFHITSLLRGPRGRYKSIEAPPAPPQVVTLTSPHKTTTSPSSSSTATLALQHKAKNTEEAACQLELQQFEFDESTATQTETKTTINNVELIPTLNFISNKPTANDIYEEQHVATTCCNTSENIEETEDDFDDQASRHTYIIEREEFECGEEVNEQQQLEGVQQQQLQQQQLQQQHLNESRESDFNTSLDFQELIARLGEVNCSSPSFFDEPTSSISIEMASLTTTTTTNTGKTTTTTPPTTTTSDEQSIEEDIEEAIEISEEDEEELALDSKSDPATDSAELAVFASTSKAAAELSNKAAAVKVNKPKTQTDLFGIGDSEESDYSSHHESPHNSLEDQFKIDDEQLSGGKLAQHFMLADDDDEDEPHLHVKLPMATKIATVHSPHESTTTGENESAAAGVEGNANQLDESTADDVSDFAEEEQQQQKQHQDDNDDDDEVVSASQIAELVSSSAEVLKSSAVEESDSKSGDLQLKHTVDNVESSRISSSKADSSTHSAELQLSSAELAVNDAKDIASLSNSKLSAEVPLEALEHSAELAAKDVKEPVSLTSSKLSAELSVHSTNLPTLKDETSFQSAELAESNVKSQTTLSSNKISPQTTELALQAVEQPMINTKLPALKIQSSLHSAELDLEVSNYNSTKSLENIALMKTVKDLAAMERPLSTGASSASSHSEKDNSIEELITSNHSIEIDLSGDEYSRTRAESPNENETMLVRMITDLDDSNEEKQTAMNIEEVSTSFSTFLRDNNTQQNSGGDDEDEDEDDDDHSLELLKLRIMAMKSQQLLQQQQTSPVQELPPSNDIIVKPMERVPLSEFSKDVLEDITEESERNSLSNATNNPDDVMEIEQSSLSMDKSVPKIVEDSIATTSAATTTTSVVSLNMIKMLEQRVNDMQELLASKDACLASLNLQLEANNAMAQQQQRRDSVQSLNYGNDQPGSGRDTSSLLTNSTEYRTLQEEFGGATTDHYVELNKRDEVIAKLTESLQQSLNAREQLQVESERLNSEIQNLRKQLNETNVDTQNRRAVYWLRADQESNGGQRISEISMDLISESDDDLDRQFLTDNEDKLSRNSRERQLSLPRQMSEASELELMGNMISSDTTAFSKQIEQFQKYLTPTEGRLFFMVQKKFDDYLCQELEKCRQKYETELKIANDQLESERQDKEQQLQRFTQVRHEKETQHAKEMEDLRKYFETKCADLEKQYSDDVFSQKSQRHGTDSSSESSSDAEQIPIEAVTLSAVTSAALGQHKIGSSTPATPHSRSKESSPRKRTRAELLLSPSHRQMTPCGDAFGEEMKDAKQLMDELKIFYQQKLQELQRNHEIKLRKLNEKLKYFESRYPEDDFMCKDTKSVNNQTVDSDQLQLTATTDDSQNPGQSSSANASLIIIDQDELNLNNEPQVIQTIMDEYEKRLREQIMLARRDIVLELEEKIQNLLSETTTDDLHWPPELILLREKLTAKSQLEIAQLQMKHEEEMSRVKQDFEKQKFLQRQKNMRRSIYEMGHDTLFAQVCNERDQLRQLLKSFHQTLSGLAKCVEGCEYEVNATLNEQAQRLLMNTNLEDQTMITPQDLQLNLSGSVLNSSLNTTGNSRRLRLLPDVQNLREVVDNPTLLQFIHSTDDVDLSERFDLKDCLARLNEEANYILQLTEQRQDDQHQNENHEVDSNEEKADDGCDMLALVQKSPALNRSAMLRTSQHFLRRGSLNETTPNAREEAIIAQFVQTLNSMPADFHYMYDNNNDGGGSESAATTPGQNNPYVVVAEITKLKMRLMESETDRQKLQEELENTISKNAELGQELKSLRDRISQLNSLNQTEYAEGYGLGTMKTPMRPSGLESLAQETFAQLQERARQILSSPPSNVQSQSLQLHPQSPENNNDYTALLIQVIEEFCRESDRIVDCNKRERDDLESQIDAADKKLKATRKFVEEQAVEREQERDEFGREIERLKSLLRDKEKEAQSSLNRSRELEQLPIQIKQQHEIINTITEQRTKMEEELKASISKIFDLREIIAELESRIEEKELNERILADKVKELKTFIDTQNRSNEHLQNEVFSLKTEIDTSYQERIRNLEQKLQNVRPSAEQSAVMEQVLEQLRDIEATLDQKTKMLESLHHSVSSNSCSHSATEDVSAQGAQVPQPLVQLTDLNSPQQTGSPVHPSPRQHSLTMEGVHRVVEKLAKHTRVEEAALKRIRDLEMQVSQMCTACVEIQQERDTLQERMSEQSQRISELQTRLDEQRQRAEDLQRIGTSDLNIRIHDLQSEVKELNEKLSVREKQMSTLKQQLEKSKTAINRLEAELTVQQQPDRSTIERLETELSQKQQEIQKLRNTIKNEMINKQHLPDLMETMLADKNDEIDLLKEQFELKLKELRTATEARSNSSLSPISGAADEAPLAREEHSAKHSGRTLSDIVSIAEFDEPDVLRRAAVSMNQATPLSLAHHRTVDTSKEAVANLTHKRSEDLSGFSQLHPASTFDNPRYFQDALKATPNSITTISPAPMMPRQINFSELSEESKLKTTPSKETVDKQLQSLEQELQSARGQLACMQTQLTASDELAAKLTAEQTKNSNLEATNAQLTEQLTKCEKELLNLREHETQLKERNGVLETKVKESVDHAANESAKLNKELQGLNEAYEQRKLEHEKLNAQLKAKDERVQQLTTQLDKSNELIATLQRRVDNVEHEMERLRQQHQQQQQQHSDNSSKLFSVEEIAQQVEKELNYSAQLDSNILKAIESEEENNLDLNYLDKGNQTSTQSSEDAVTQQGTDDENFTGERELLNQLEVLRAQIVVERERNDGMRRELFAEKQHSQDVQEQDIAVLSALRKRLEKAIEQEDELHKQLDLERERYECLNAQYTALQRAESRRNSALLLKSPGDSPRKGANSILGERTTRSLGDFESELAERLRSEIKLLTAQNERERERSTDMQRGSEREFTRYKNELNERKEYCEQLNREMHKLQREKEIALQDCEHLQDRLTLQSQEIESLEWRLATLQEAEAQRAARRERHQKESAQLLAEVQELKTAALATDADREASRILNTQLRCDLERATEREKKLTEALAEARDNYAPPPPPALMNNEENVPLKLLQNEIEVKRQMAETLQLLTEERCQLQSKCEELEKQLGNRSTVQELEERCKQLLGRYLRIESYRKALVYQKRYLKLSLLSYEAGERCLAVLHGKENATAEAATTTPRRNAKKLFKTVAIAAVAIHRMKYIVNMWRSGKRIVSKSTFTITQQKRSPIQAITMPSTMGVVSSTTASPAAIMNPNSPRILTINEHIINNNNNNNTHLYNNNIKKITSNGKVN